MSGHTDEQRDAILRMVEDYFAQAFPSRPFVPGTSRVQYAGRVFDQADMAAMVDAVLDFWLTLGRFGERFEAELQKLLGVTDVILVNSGSSANLTATATMMSRQLPHLRMQPGDEVITPAVTFPTTLAPLTLYGLTPVFIDCELQTLNLDVSQLEEALSPRTRAIVIPHTLGNPCDLDVISAFARQHDLFLMEDMCDALGSTYDGRPVGTFGDMATLSFYPAHHITMGEGGAVVTSDSHLAKVARSVRSWGRGCYCGWNEKDPCGACGHRFDYKVRGLDTRVDHRYYFVDIGYNLKPTDIQAALGVSQLAKFPRFAQRRRENFRFLRERLRPFEEFFILPEAAPKADPCWFAFTITVRDGAPFTRGQLVAWLEAHNIETRPVFAGNILRQPAYERIPHRIVGTLDNSDYVMRNSFFVGVYPGLTAEMLEYVVGTIVDFVDRTTRTGVPPTVAAAVQLP
jgi:CDP-6-deoxy-D-xylo-4-hexulose-3-dehydrase